MYSTNEVGALHLVVKVWSFRVTKRRKEEDSMYGCGNLVFRKRIALRSKGFLDLDYYKGLMHHQHQQLLLVDNYHQYFLQSISLQTPRPNLACYSVCSLMLGNLPRIHIQGHFINLFLKLFNLLLVYN